MVNSRLSLLTFSISFLCLFLSIQAKRNYHIKHKYFHHHKTNAISEPLSPSPPPPQPADPNNSIADPSPSPEAPSPSDDGNADNSVIVPAPSPEPTNPHNGYNSTHASSPSIDTTNPPNEGNGHNSAGAPSPSPSLPLSPSPSPSPAASPNDGNVLNVRKFGAVGDGIIDETEAFKMAWDTACQTDSALILVPYGFSFMIQSTIFNGPC